MGETATQERPAMCPDLYRSDKGAPEYVGLTSTRAFNEERKRIEKEHGVKIKGRRTVFGTLYHRDQLDAMARLMLNVGDEGDDE